MSDQANNATTESNSTLLGDDGAAGANVNMMAGFDNLMSLASFDTSDLQAQMSRLAREGIYLIELGKLGFTEQAPTRDPADPMNYQLNIPGNILSFIPLEVSADPTLDDLTGRSLNERYFVYGKDIKEAIQLLMGKFKSAGFRHKGVMGGVEGSAPGWIEEAMGKRVVVRVHHYKPKDGEERAQFTWLNPFQLQKANIDLAILGRDFLDEFGRPIEDPIAAFSRTKKAAA